MEEMLRIVCVDCYAWTMSQTSDVSSVEHFWTTILQKVFWFFKKKLLGEGSNVHNLLGSELECAYLINI